MTGPTAERNVELATAVGEWFRSQRWTLWLGPTFRQQVPLSACLEAVDGFLAASARQLNDHLHWALGAGHGAANGAAHAHVLVRPDKASEAVEATLRAVWRDLSPTTGTLDIRHYDANRGGALYQARHQVFAAGVACPRWPCCRRHPGGCAVFPEST